MRPRKSRCAYWRAWSHLPSSALISFPRDPQAGGTWIASTDENYTLCLLNGAFKKHQWDPPYRLSRGLVLLDFFKYNDPNKFRTAYNFSDVEPFTLLIIGSVSNNSTEELRWDGQKIHHTELDPAKPFIKSSVTLYDDDTIRFKRDLFNKWV